MWKFFKANLLITKLQLHFYPLELYCAPLPVDQRVADSDFSTISPQLFNYYLKEARYACLFCVTSLSFILSLCVYKPQYVYFINKKKKK